MKKKIGITVVGQGFVGLVNFLITLSFLKFSSPGEFGVYALIFSIMLLFGGIQNALVNTPLAVYHAAALDHTLQTDIDQSIKLVSRVNNLMAALMVFLAWWLLAGADWLFSAAVGLLILAHQVREYHKNRAIVMAEVTKSALSDILYSVMFVMAMAYLAQTEVTVEYVVYSQILAMAISSFIFIGSPVKSIGIKPAWQTYRAIFTDSRWSLLGVFSSEIQSRGYIYILAYFFSANIVGLVQAGKVFFGPLNMVVMAWGKIYRPKFAKMIAQNDPILKIMLISALTFGAMNAVFYALAIINWDLISGLIFSDEYSNVKIYFSLWSVVLLFVHWRTILSIVCQSAKLFKPLAIIGMISVVISLLSLVIILNISGVEFVPVSVVLSEIFLVIGLISVLKNRGVGGHASA